MRKATRLTAILGATLHLLSAGVVQAGVINTATVGGLGGSGTVLFATPTPENDDAFSIVPNVINLNYFFTAVAQIDAMFFVQGQPGDGTTEYLTTATITNNTGTPWIDFHFSLFGTPPGMGLDFDTPSRNPTPTSTVFSTLVHGDNALDWSGGVVPDGGSVIFTFSIDVPFVPNAFFGLHAEPSIAQAQAVPEPGSLALAGCGILSLLGYGWQRRKGTFSASGVAPGIKLNELARSADREPIASVRIVSTAFCP